MSYTQLLHHTANGTTYADPANPDYTVRFKTTSNQKLVSGVKMINSIHELIINDVHDVTKGLVTVSDNLSVRVRISGSLDSRARLSAILSGLAAQLVAWDSENVFIGFEPTTLPTIPASA